MQFAEEEGQSIASPANKKHATWIHDPVPRSQSKFLWMKRYETGEPSKLSSKNERLCRIMHNNSMKSKPFPQNGTLLQKRESSPFKRFYMGFDVSLWMVLLYLTWTSVSTTSAMDSSLNPIQGFSEIQGTFSKATKIRCI